MKKVLLMVILLLLVCSQYSFAGKCPEVGDALFSVRESNFPVFPIEKYPAIKLKIEDAKCPPPTKIRMPNSIIAIERLLSASKIVKLWVTGGRNKEGGSLLEARWQRLLLNLFDSNNNFSMVERARLEDILTEQSRAQSGIMSQNDIAHTMKLFGATHMLIVDGQREKWGIFKTDYYTGRLVDMETGKVMTVDEMED